MECEAPWRRTAVLWLISIAMILEPAFILLSPLPEAPPRAAAATAWKPRGTAACSLRETAGGARTSGRLVAVGDIHGEAVGLLEVLWRAGTLVTDPRGESVQVGSEFERCADAGVDGCRPWAERVCAWGGLGPHSGGGGGGSNATSKLVQVGDIMDRGAHSLQAWACLDAQQRSAPPGAVVRLVGNHELMWLGGRFRYANRADTQPRIASLNAAVKDGILSGRVVAAHVEVLGGGHGGKATGNATATMLFTHAGLRADMLDLLAREIRAAKAAEAAEAAAVAAFVKGAAAKGRAKAGAGVKAGAAVTAFEIAAHLNRMLKDQVRACSPPRCSFSHQAFDAGPERRGSGIGGPYWTDFSVLKGQKRWRAPAWPPPSAEAEAFERTVVQIVGHSAARCTLESDPRCSPIQVTEGLSSIDVDAAMYRGGRAFLSLQDNIFSMHAKTSSAPEQWDDLDLSDALCSGGNKEAQMPLSKRERTILNRKQRQGEQEQERAGPSPITL
jgi:hypothetical protein